LEYFPVAPKKKRVWIMWAIVVTQNPDGTWKVGKVPHIATSNGGRYKAASDNPSNWHTLKDAQAAYRLNGDQR
jgi:hypothetical protein